jgi:hypothetical protein
MGEGRVRVEHFTACQQAHHTQRPKKQAFGGVSSQVNPEVINPHPALSHAWERVRVFWKTSCFLDSLSLFQRL